MKKRLFPVLLIVALLISFSISVPISNAAAAVSTWTPYVIDNIVVTNGNIEFGTWTDANSNNWAAVDDLN